MSSAGHHSMMEEKPVLPSATGYLRQTGDGYILTDIAWDNIDMAIVAQYSAPTMTTSGNTLVLASVSNATISKSQIGSGRAHAWTIAYKGNPDEWIALANANGNGDVYRYFRDTGTFIRADDSTPPIFNTLYYTPYNGWTSNRAFAINGTWESPGPFIGGTINNVFPSQNIALFAHANPSSIISAYDGKQRIFRVHSATIKVASTGETLREFVASSANGAPGMFDLITKAFFPATGSFIYEDVGGTFAPAV